MMSTRDCVTVVVRIRSENEKERGHGGLPAVKAVDDHMIVFDPKIETSPEFRGAGRKRGNRDLNKRMSRNVFFAFDCVFDSNATNEDVFERSTRPIIDNVLEGYNACVFAYGATGAGKTYTMLGTAECPGVTFRSVMLLFERIEASKSSTSYDVAVSYLEVYNENIRDLLMPAGFLPLRESDRGGVIVTGLSLHKPRNAEELLHMLEFGNKNRTQHPTDANAESSRSHAVFQVFIKQKDLLANGSKVGKLSLIDLAGSERATATTNQGARFREGANINRSLLALGNCINALADGKSKGYVPYRNSKLTRLLKDSLGGNCRTVMIAAVSPSCLTFEDTYNTLKYANRAKEIKINLKQNNVNVDNLISQYPQIVSGLRQQVSELQLKLQAYEAQTVIHPLVPPPDPVLTNQIEEGRLERWKAELQEVFDSRINIRKELMELDGSEKIISLKIHKKELTLNRLNRLVSDTAEQHQARALSASIQRSTAAARMRVNQIASRKTVLAQRMDDNSVQLHHIESAAEMNPAISDRRTMAEINLLKCYHHTEVELRESRQHVKYLKKIARILQRESTASEKLICALLRIVRKNHYILKGNDLVTSDTQSDMDSLHLLLKSQTGVGWADENGSLIDYEQTSAQSSSSLDFEQLLQFPTLNIQLTPMVKSSLSSQAVSPSERTARAASDTTTIQLSNPCATTTTQGCNPSATTATPCAATAADAFKERLERINDMKQNSSVTDNNVSSMNCVVSSVNQSMSLVEISSGVLPTVPVTTVTHSLACSLPDDDDNDVIMGSKVLDMDRGLDSTYTCVSSSTFSMVGVPVEPVNDDSSLLSTQISPYDLLKSCMKQLSKTDNHESSSTDTVVGTQSLVRAGGTTGASPSSSAGTSGSSSCSQYTAQDLSPAFVPRGKLSFADIVKSPAPPSVSRKHHQPIHNTITSTGSLSENNHTHPQCGKTTITISQRGAVAGRPAAVGDHSKSPGSRHLPPSMRPLRSPLASKENIPVQQWNSNYSHVMKKSDLPQQQSQPKWLKKFGNSSQHSLPYPSGFDTIKKSDTTAPDVEKRVEIGGVVNGNDAERVPTVFHFTGRSGDPCAPSADPFGSDMSRIPGAVVVPSTGRLATLSASKLKGQQRQLMLLPRAAVARLHPSKSALRSEMRAAARLSFECDPRRQSVGGAGLGGAGLERILSRGAGGGQLSTVHEQGSSSSSAVKNLTKMRSTVSSTALNRHPSSSSSSSCVSSLVASTQQPPPSKARRMIF